MSTMSRPCPAAGRCCRGSSLNRAGSTCYEGETGRTVFSLAIGDAFRDGDGFVGGEVGDVVGRGSLGLWVGLEKLGRGHEGVTEMGLSFDEDGANSAILGCLCQDCTHTINIIKVSTSSIKLNRPILKQQKLMVF